MSQSNSTALAERLQRLKAGLEKPRQGSKSLQPGPLTSVAQQQAPNRPAVLQTAAPLAGVKPPASSGSSRSQSEDYEHLPSLSTAPEPMVRGAAQPLQKQDGQDAEFEMVSSPHEAVKTLSGGSPSSEPSTKGEESMEEPGGAQSQASREVPSEELRRVKQELKSFEAENTALRDSLAAETEQKEDLAAQMRALRGAYTEARDGAEAMTEDLSRLQQECNSLRTQLKEATSASLRQARQEEASNMGSRLERAERAIEKERASVLRLEQLLAESRSQQVPQMQAAIARAEERAGQAEAALRQQQQTAAAQAGQVHELQQQVRTLEDRAARAEATARSLDGQLSAAGTALQEARHDAIGLRAANQRLTTEMQRLVALSQERDRLSADTAAQAHNDGSAASLEDAPSLSAGSQPQLSAVSPAQLLQHPPDPEEAQAPSTAERALQEDDDGVTEIPLNSPQKAHGPEQLDSSHGSEPEVQPGKEAPDAELRGLQPGTSPGLKVGLWAYITGADKAATVPAKQLYTKPVLG